MTAEHPHDGQRRLQLRRDWRVRAAVVSAVVLAALGLLIWLGAVLLLGDANGDSLGEDGTDWSLSAFRDRVERSWHVDGKITGLISATTVTVVDGDTAVFELEDGTRERVRLIGIDTPELGEVRSVYGVASATRAEAALRKRSRVYLELGPDERDGYGRLLAYVWLSEPSAEPAAEDVRSGMLNAKMLLDGYAKLYARQPNVRYSELFRVLLEEARAEERGLWDPVFAHDAGMESEWSRTSPADVTEITSPYVGNLGSKKFHTAECVNAQDIRLAYRVPFESTRDALAAGYVPCRICKP